MEQMWTQFLVSPLMSLVDQLQSYLGSFGAAIIGLAVLVRVLLLPLTLAQLNYNRRVLALAPEIGRLKQTWAKDAARLNQETVALYRQAGADPTVGCLTPIVRLVVDICLWFGVYQVVRHDPAARASFLWLPNLADPNGLPLPSPFLSYGTLVVLLIAAHILYQVSAERLRILSSQSRGGDTVVWLGPAAVAILVPAGLVLYWVTSSLCDLFVMLWAAAPTSTSRIARQITGVVAAAGMALIAFRAYQATESIWLAAYLGIALGLTVFSYLGGSLFGTYRRAQFVYYLIPYASLYWALSFMLQHFGPTWVAAVGAAVVASLVAVLATALLRQIAPRFSLEAQLGSTLWLGSATSVAALHARLRRLDLDQLKKAVERGEQVVSSQPAVAVKHFTTVVAGLQSVVQPSDEEKDYLARAYFGLGQVNEGANQATPAVENYTRAYRLGSVNALLRLATLLARMGKTDDKAFQVYIDYLKARRAGTLSPEDEAILGVVASMCQVKVGDKPAAIQVAVARAQAVLGVDPDIEWASYDLGIGYLELGYLDDAQSALERARTLNPDRAATHLGLGLVALRRGQPDQARSHLEASLRLDPAQPDVAYQLGDLLLAPLVANALESSSPDGQARLAAATSWLETATQLDPRHAKSCYALGRAALLAGDSARAAQVLERATTLDPRHKEAQYYLGVAYRSLGQTPKAEQAFRQAIQIEHNYGPAQRDLADLLFQGGQYAEAADYYRGALQADAQDGVARCGLGCSLYELGMYPQAAEQLARVTSDSPNALFYLARAQMRMRQFDPAIANLEQLARQDSQHVAALYYLGCAYAHVGAGGRADAYEAALSAFERCSEAQPHYWPAYLQMGHLFLKRDDVSNAKRCYLQAQVYQPCDAEVLHALGQVAYRCNDLLQARDMFEQAVSEAPDARRSHQALGIVYERVCETSKAIAAYRRADAHSLLGALRCREGDYAGAAASLRQAVIVGDESDMVLNYLGFALVQVREYDAALAVWSKLKERQPDDPRLALNLVRLQYLRGREHALAGRYAEAAEAWTMYLKTYVDDNEVKRDLASVYVRFGGMTLNGHLNGAGHGTPDDTPARQAFEQALELQPDLADAEYGLALLDLMAGDSQQSTARLRGLVQAVPYASEYKYHLALALLQQDQVEEAMRLLQQVLASANDQRILRRAKWATGAVYGRDGQWERAARVFSETV
ncbi:MAG: membrane protein insertase YidC [Anaerolineae bacterium]